VSRRRYRRRRRPRSAFPPASLPTPPPGEGRSTDDDALQCRRGAGASARASRVGSSLHRLSACSRILPVAQPSTRSDEEWHTCQSRVQSPNGRVKNRAREDRRPTRPSTISADRSPNVTSRHLKRLASGEQHASSSSCSGAANATFRAHTVSHPTGIGLPYRPEQRLYGGDRYPAPDRRDTAIPSRQGCRLPNGRADDPVWRFDHPASHNRGHR